MVSAIAMEALRQHRVLQLNEQMRLRLVWEDNGLVFPDEIGRLWGPDSVSHQFTRLAQSIGLSLTFHGLRHSHATHLLRAGVHPKVASGRLGHSSIGITMDLYSHLLSDAQDGVAQLIDDVFSKALK